MANAELILDTLIMKIIPPPNATLSQSFDSYKEAVKYLEAIMSEEYKKGYNPKNSEVIQEKINKQVKSN